MGTLSSLFTFCAIAVAVELYCLHRKFTGMDLVQAVIVIFHFEAMLMFISRATKLCLIEIKQKLDRDWKKKVSHLLQRIFLNKHTKSWMCSFHKSLTHRPLVSTVNAVMDSKMDLYIFRRFLCNDLTSHHGMHMEMLRLSTFRTFPKCCPSPLTLAKAGFFYSGQVDEVICFSCNVRISGWQQDDVPMECHRARSPDCGFVNNENCRNVSIALQDYNSEYASTSNDDRGQDVQDSSIQTTNVMLHLNGAAYSKSVCTESGSSSGAGVFDTQYTVDSSSGKIAQYPEYTDKQARLQSFDRGWPDYVRQTPQMMVESGFFFIGYEDCVCCFQCGLGLHSWESFDDPHKEHARWSPNCKFLLNSSAQAILAQFFTEESHTLIYERNRTSQNTASEENNVATNRFISEGTVAATNEMTSLKNENDELRKRTLCKRCLARDVSVVSLHCGHFIACDRCATSMRLCPICGKQIKATFIAHLT